MVYVWNEVQCLSSSRALFVEAEHVGFARFRSWRVLPLSTYMQRGGRRDQSKSGFWSDDAPLQFQFQFHLSVAASLATAASNDLTFGAKHDKSPM
jgi:hypothetical protein